MQIDPKFRGGDSRPTLKIEYGCPEVPARLIAQTEFAMTNPRTILIVDDDVDLAEGLKLVLSRGGYRILQARDGRQAKEVVDRERPDLVIIDMMMPKMGGYPVLEHYKDHTDAPPFIMITANEGTRHKAYAEYLGVVDYIRKPFAMDRLLETVHKILAPQTDAAT